MKKYPVLITYVRTPDNGRELRYTLRSLDNVTNWNGKVYILGDTEEWLQNVEHIPVNRYYGRPYFDQIHKILHACTQSVLPEKFIITMDDVYVKYPTNVRVYFKGILQINNSNFYNQTKTNTMEWLISQGLSITDYENHAPMLVDRDDLTAALKTIMKQKSREKFQWRSVYGNMHNIGGIRIEDAKTRTKELKDGMFLSTAYYTEELEKLFTRPSIFEADAVV